MSKPEALRNALEKAFRMGASFSRSDVELGHMIQADFAAHVIEQCAEVEALRADAGRWRWLRSRPPETPTNGPDFVLWVECYGEAPRNEKADAAVDAAMAKELTK